MKKLLLFIFILFTLSAICSANAIPLENCGNGSWQPSGQCSSHDNYDGKRSSVTKTSAFAYDKTSGAYGKGSSYHSEDQAKKIALQNCGTKNCKIIASKYGIVIGSSNGVVLGSNYKSWHTGMKVDDYIVKRDNLMKKCTEMGGIDCKIIWDNTLKYNPE